MKTCFAGGVALTGLLICSLPALASRPLTPEESRRVVEAMKSYSEVQPQIDLVNKHELRAVMIRTIEKLEKAVADAKTPKARKGSLRKEIKDQKKALAALEAELGVTKGADSSTLPTPVKTR